MATPVYTLTAQKVFGSCGAFADVYEDRTRAGDTGMQFQYIGRRGARVQVEAIAFFIDRDSALAAKAGWEAMQGQEIYLANILDQKMYQVFLFAVAADDPRAVVTAGLNGETYQLRARLDIARTA
jgi:hypothetical protein